MQGLDGRSPSDDEVDRLVDEFLERDLLPSDVTDQVRQLRADEGAGPALERILEERKA